MAYNVYFKLIFHIPAQKGEKSGGRQVFGLGRDFQESLFLALLTPNFLEIKNKFPFNLLLLYTLLMTKTRLFFSDPQT